METKIGFVLSFIAGLSTLFGAFIIFISKKQDKFIVSSLSFASSVMFFISILDLIPESYSSLNNDFTSNFTILTILLFITIGISISCFIENLIPEKKEINNSHLFKLGIISMIAIILHNIPEGMATFIATSSNLKLGITLTIAITLHNIPEGISIALPIYYASGNKKKAFLYTFISGMSEPLGAFLAYIILSPYINNITLGILFAIISGIMIHISLFELLPSSLKYKNYKYSSIFIILGIIIVLLSKLFL